MSIIVATTARSLIYFFAMTIGLVASIIIARKLSVDDYALYQFMVKRVPNYILLPVTILGFWAYRYTAERITGSARCHIKACSLYALIVAPLALYAASLTGIDYVVSTLIMLVLASRVMAACSLNLVSALHPVRFSVAELARRLTYGLVVVLLVYIHRLGLLGAFTATILSTTIVVALSLSWLKRWLREETPCIKLVSEWLRKAYVPLAASLALLVYSLDTAIAYKLVGSFVVAGFFALQAVFNIFAEPIRVGFAYFSAYVLSTGDVEATLLALKLTIAAVTVVAVYVAIHSVYVLYLLNPVYEWASIAAPILAASFLLDVLGIGLAQTYSGTLHGGVSRSRELLRLNLLALIASIIYLLLVTIGLVLARNTAMALVSWVTAHLVRSCINALRVVVVEPKMRGTVKKHLAWLMVYVMLVAPLALVFPPLGPPSRSFWTTLSRVAPSAIVVALLYFMAVILVDRDARLVAVKALKKFTGLTRFS